MNVVIRQGNQLAYLYTRGLKKIIDNLPHEDNDVFGKYKARADIIDMKGYISKDQNDKVKYMLYTLEVVGGKLYVRNYQFIPGTEEDNKSGSITRGLFN